MTLHILGLKHRCIQNGLLNYTLIGKSQESSLSSYFHNSWSAHQLHSASPLIFKYVYSYNIEYLYTDIP